MGIELLPITFMVDESGYRISLEGDKSSDIYIVDSIERKSDQCRELWFENTIHYSIDNTPKCNENLKLLLKDLFGFSTFKPGQLESLQILLNGNANTLCILPTGGGKSLLYYFVAMLQPSPTIVIAPTDILIKDQIRNMQEIHSINDVQVVTEEDLYIKGRFQLCNKYIFMTPIALQHRALIYNIIDFNVKLKLAAIVLDEVHTISNWSHDFRPDYLMLSFNLMTYMDNARYMSFTATANYRVLNDIALL